MKYLLACDYSGSVEQPVLPAPNFLEVNTYPSDTLFPKAGSELVIRGGCRTMQWDAVPSELP